MRDEAACWLDQPYKNPHKNQSRTIKIFVVAVAIYSLISSAGPAFVACVNSIVNNICPIPENIHAPKTSTAPG